MQVSFIIFILQRFILFHLINNICPSAGFCKCLSVKVYQPGTLKLEVRAWIQGVLYRKRRTSKLVFFFLKIQQTLNIDFDLICIELPQSASFQDVGQIPFLD